MAHTPGPWEWQDGEAEGGDLMAPSVEEEALANEDGAPFPKWLHISTNAFELGNPDDLSLSSAAPDLLAELRLIVDGWALKGRDLTMWEAERLEFAMVAIAQAEGRDAK